MKILIVEDERKIASFLSQGLESEGFCVDIATDGESGLAFLKTEEYAVVILDVNLPKLNGVALCREYRQSGGQAAVLMLSAKDTVEDRVLGLNAGADDYVVKPFSLVELLARIRGLLRRTQSVKSEVLSAGDLSLNTATCAVFRHNKTIALSATELKLLRFMLENKGRVLSKPMILENVWGYSFNPDSNIVEVYIKYLRDKVDKGFDAPLIQTVHGMGYKICDPV